MVGKVLGFQILFPQLIVNILIEFLVYLLVILSFSLQWYDPYNIKKIIRNWWMPFIWIFNDSQIALLLLAYTKRHIKSHRYKTCEIDRVSKVYYKIFEVNFEIKQYFFMLNILSQNSDVSIQKNNMVYSKNRITKFEMFRATLRQRIIDY